MDRLENGPRRPRGRPRLPAEESKKAPLNLRITGELRAQLEGAARRSGRSLAGEAETRLRESLRNELALLAGQVGEGQDQPKQAGEGQDQPEIRVPPEMFRAMVTFVESMQSTQRFVNQLSSALRQANAHVAASKKKTER